MSIRTKASQDNGSFTRNLLKDLEDLAKTLGYSPSIPHFETAAYANGGTSVINARIEKYTAGGTVAAHTFNLPAAPEDGQIHTVITDQVTTAATWGVASPGTATIEGGPTATAVNVPITFKFVKAQNKWFRV